MSLAESMAELELARALAALGREKGGPGEERARAWVGRAEQKLREAKATPIGRDQRTCCERPMLWSDGRWICATGLHDD